MPKFVPDNFTPRPSDIEWAMSKYRINREEADRQIEEMRDHEFKRNYTDWNRVLRNWFRCADKHGLLKREREYRKPAEYTEAQRKADAAKAWADMNRLRAIK